MPKKRRLVTDVEIYHNYLLIAFRDIDSEEEFAYEAFGRDGVLSRAQRKGLKRIMQEELGIGFNLINFDNCIIWAAIKGRTVEEMKEIADRIILGNAKFWEIDKEFDLGLPRNLDQIDLIEVAPGKASLKIYNGRNHGKRMQDLPIEPEAILTEDEIEETYDYCFNDLDATEGLFHRLKGELALRRNLSKEYGIDLRSKSDAQVAEAIIKHRIEKIKGDRITKPDIKAGKKYQYEAPDFLEFRHPEMIEVMDIIENSYFVVGKNGHIDLPERLAGAEICIGDGVYRMGIGGLHSSEKTQSIVCRDDWILRDSDVTSYYPSIIIRTGLYPPHLGPAFLRVYKGIVDRRVEDKRAASDLGKEIKRLEAEGGEDHFNEIAELKKRQTEHKIAADGGKIMVNGSFGKFGSKYSALYAPNLVIQTTITGQLSLLMLIEWLEEDGFRVVSANTDGIVSYFPKKREKEYLAIIKEWEEATGFNMEFTDYAGLHSRDVNSYIAIKKDGEVKTKGAYSSGGLMNNPQNEISIDAAVEHLKTGKSMSKHIRACTDIRKFITVRTVNGGALWADEDMPNALVLKQGIFLGKAIRWYYSRTAETAIFYKKPNKSGTHNRVPKSEGARPMMTMLKEFPDDIDYRYYLREAQSILEAVGYADDVV